MRCAGSAKPSTLAAQRPSTAAREQPAADQGARHPGEHDAREARPREGGPRVVERRAHGGVGERAGRGADRRAQRDLPHAQAEQPEGVRRGRVGDAGREALDDDRPDPVALGQRGERLQPRAADLGELAPRAVPGDEQGEDRTEDRGRDGDDGPDHRSEQDPGHRREHRAGDERGAQQRRQHDVRRRGERPERLDPPAHGGRVDEVEDPEGDEQRDERDGEEGEPGDPST